MNHVNHKTRPQAGEAGAQRQHFVPQNAYLASPACTHKTQEIKAKCLDRNLRIRLNEFEDKALLMLAAKAGQKTRSRLVRKMIRDAAQVGPDLLDDDLSRFREAVREIAALGRNVNQITRAMNAGQTLQPGWDSHLLLAVAFQVGVLRKELVEVVQRSRDRWVKYL